MLKYHKLLRINNSLGFTDLLNQIIDLCPLKWTLCILGKIFHIFFCCFDLHSKVLYILKCLFNQGKREV